MVAISQRIANELQVKVTQAQAAIELMQQGATVPFIARYRKEATNGLDDTQLRYVEERLYYLDELDKRREVILASIDEQKKLTPALRKALEEVETKTQLEDLYLPYKPIRTSKAKVAVEAGLQSLADSLLADPQLDPVATAAAYINSEKAVEDAQAALDGARHILIERIATDAALLSRLREYVWENAVLTATVVPKKLAEAKKQFADYFAYEERIKTVPSHRALALFRGRKEGLLRLALRLNEPDIFSLIANFFPIAQQSRPADSWLWDTLQASWKQKLATKIECELLARLREFADEGAIKVFATNLRSILLAAPAGAKVTMGLDPAIRTGVKIAVVDHTGKLLDYTTVYPLAPANEWQQSLAMLAKLASQHKVEFISIGNGTGSRETVQLVTELISAFPALNLKKVLVNEAGASVYSASALAAAEFPDLDVSLRGAASIARRLQDPLAELVKIEPKSLGVGQYQHDVQQSKLKRALDNVVEDSVNAVGVDLNTASVAILSRVAGLSDVLADNIVKYRDEHGAFTSREQLLNVPRMGEKSFQQAAGFLRIRDGSNPLDASAVHPEAYPVVEAILMRHNKSMPGVIGNHQFLKSINAADYCNDTWGLPTVIDILQELEKPGRDPRPDFKLVSFKEGVNTIDDLSEGMLLEGVVSNVTHFGAFVDIGVHQDGLVHISEIAHQFVGDASKLVKAGAIVTVKVISVDKSRQRINLSMRQAQERAPKAPKHHAKSHVIKDAKTKNSTAKLPAKAKPKAKIVANSAMADALSQLKLKSSS